ncbi:MAG: hypothetical protein LBG59_01845 [Candidatus Peribacteria bacterium]|jgi:hypothetical protein|nr:hypothetical protein [Candidatus Peribacteria bacterium]
MILNEVGIICNEELHIMLQKRPSVDVHEYVIMPNHVHLLLCIGKIHNIDINSEYRREEAYPLPNGEAVNFPNSKAVNPANISHQTL